MALEAIENVIWEDAGNRELIPLAQRGELETAAVSLLKGKHVIIVNGFYINQKQSGETDGPLGTLFLAQALEKLGLKVTLLTSPFNGEILRSGSRALQLSCPVIQVEPGDEFSIFPELIIDPDLTHLIAIEQMGSAIDGRYYNMHGQDISKFTARFDSFFLMAREKGITTIGIGDGGNEIGMGKMFPVICRKKKFGRISCITPTDHLIVGGVSNWGAYGLIAALCHFTRQPLLQSAREEEELLKVIVKAGAVDGKTLEHTLSVDGLPISKHIEIVQKLWTIIDRK
jgi:hypothetical protein